MRLMALAAIALALVQTDVAGAQPARRTPVVGMLCTTCWNQLYPMSKEYAPTPGGVAFQEGLRESGYVLGESVQLTPRGRRGCPSGARGIRGAALRGVGVQ